MSDEPQDRVVNGEVLPLHNLPRLEPPKRIANWQREQMTDEEIAAHPYSQPEAGDE